MQVVPADGDGGLDAESGGWGIVVLELVVMAISGGWRAGEPAINDACGSQLFVLIADQKLSRALGHGTGGWRYLDISFFFPRKPGLPACPACHVTYCLCLCLP